MYLYLYFKYFFGWLLVLVLKILLQSILPNTDGSLVFCDADWHGNCRVRCWSVSDYLGHNRCGPTANYQSAWGNSTHSDC